MQKNIQPFPQRNIVGCATGTAQRPRSRRGWLEQWHQNIVWRWWDFFQPRFLDTCTHTRLSWCLISWIICGCLTSCPLWMKRSLILGQSKLCRELMQEGRQIWTSMVLQNQDSQSTGHWWVDLSFHQKTPEIPWQLQQKTIEYNYQLNISETFEIVRYT